MGAVLGFGSFPPPDDPGLSVLVPSAVDSTFNGFIGLFVVMAVVVLGLGIRRWMRYAQHGIDPTVVDVDLQAKLLKSDLLAGERAEPVARRTVTERLAELDALLAAGTISAEEHAAARATVLEDV